MVIAQVAAFLVLGFIALIAFDELSRKFDFIMLVVALTLLAVDLYLGYQILEAMFT